MAREFKAFTCAGKIETPLQLLRLVLLYAGLDKPLRTVATTFTLTVPTTSRVGLPLERVIVVGNRWHGLDREVGQGVLGFFERFRTPGDEKRQGSDFL
ncbi:MAG: hypothetical protein HY731_09150 [Candidatus Tectomicrobia bacterium]|nr:hypothetical protein [Candidatus Tectomicrobia bacterium]